LLAVCLAAPWTLRNAVTFGRFVPSKSNVFYEARWANYTDDDGIWDGNFGNHPHNSPLQRFEYARLGEAAFINAQRDAFLAELARDPWRYVRNVLNRARAIALWYTPNRWDTAPPLKLALQRFVYVLPLLGLVAYGMLGVCATSVMLLAVFWALYFVPYVLVAFYTRYFLPMTPILVLFAFLGADRTAYAIRRRRARLLQGVSKLEN
jgi:hypothetical protein